MKEGVVLFIRKQPGGISGREDFYDLRFLVLPIPSPSITLLHENEVRRWTPSLSFVFLFLPPPSVRLIFINEARGMGTSEKRERALSTSFRSHFFLRLGHFDFFFWAGEKKEGDNSFPSFMT